MRPSYSLVPWTTAGTKSGPVTLDGNQLVGFIMPVTAVSTSIKFNMATTKNISSGGIAWMPVCDSSGAQLSFTTTTTTLAYYGFSQDQICKFEGVELFQMVAGSSEAANQSILAVFLPRPYP